MRKDCGGLRRFDHCRIGSLEINCRNDRTIASDHCRIGSLETLRFFQENAERDHCRIGSLENYSPPMDGQTGDHCRIGSLEKEGKNRVRYQGRSLPHRQLRKVQKFDDLCLN